MNDPEIKFYTKEESKKRFSKFTNVYALSFFMLAVSILFFASLSFISFNSTRQCLNTAEKQTSESFEFMKKTHPAGLESNDKMMHESIRKNKLEVCLRSSFFARNSFRIYGISISFVGLFIICFLYLFIFEKSKNDIRIGRAVIAALILSAMALLSGLFGFIGNAISWIFGIWMVMILLKTNIFSAFFFIVFINILNFILMNMLLR